MAFSSKGCGEEVEKGWRSGPPTCPTSSTGMLGIHVVDGAPLLALSGLASRCLGCQDSTFFSNLSVDMLFILSH